MLKKHIFIFGLGYVGQHLAHSLSAHGWHITGTTRTPGKLKDKVPSHWQIIAFDKDRPIPDLSDRLSVCTHLLTTISPLSGTDPVLAIHEHEVASFGRWSGYVSSTSVYPSQIERQSKGQEFIDENIKAAPATLRGHHRLTAELAWLEKCDAEIFRVAGIYGPGRSVIEALSEGRARIIENKGQLSNRIHRSDITKIILAAIEQPRPRRILNLCDYEPSAQGDVVRFAAQLLGIAPPKPIPLEKAELSEMARSFYVTNRRIRSALVGPELGVRLDFPTYRDGLRALIAGKD